MSKRIAIIGAGNMGTVLQNALSGDHQITMITRSSFNQTDWSTFEAVCFAIKPQDFKQLTPLPLGGKLIVSVMAGITTTSLQTMTNSNQVVRCMPNTPMIVRTGMTVWCKTPAVTDVSWLLTALEPVTKLLEVTNDDWIDKATAVSASGPGYLFQLIEDFTEATIQLGFSPADAKLLVTETVVGSVSLLKQSGLTAAELRQQVTSKGGTTAAGLEQLDTKLFEKILTAAYQRAKDLSNAV